jgi:hypothetical protein
MTTVLEYCKDIIQIALQQVNKGSHYLWGATGATPGGNEGTINRPESVILTPPRTDPANPAIFAAQCSVDRLHICGGRWDGANGGIQGGRAANATDSDLITYLTELNKKPQETWKPYFEFFSPRMVEGYTVRSQLVWGEDCRDKQHFDCIGFVNYCVEKALSSTRSITYSIPQWASDISGTTAVPLGDPSYPADILIIAPGGNFKHIGFLVGDGNAASGDLGNVVQAEQTSTGIVTRPYIQSSWTYRRRLTSALLH